MHAVMSPTWDQASIEEHPSTIEPWGLRQCHPAGSSGSSALPEAQVKSALGTRVAVVVGRQPSLATTEYSAILLFPVI